MKKYLILLFLSLLAGLAAGCGQQALPTPTIQPQALSLQPTTAVLPTEPPTAVPTATATRPAPSPTTPPTSTPPPTAVSTPTVTPTLTAEPVSDALIDTLWQWQQYVPAAGEESTAVADPAQYSLVFSADGNFFMQADCNMGTGTYTAVGALSGNVALTLGPSTLAACAPESLSSQFMSLPDSRLDFTIQEDGQQMSLFLPDDGGEYLFVNAGEIGSSPAEEAVITAEMAGILEEVWQWTSFTNPATGPEAIAEPARYQLRLAADGRIFIRADCNTGSGVYSLDQSSIAIVPGTMTRADCPADSQAETFLQHLDNAVLWFIDDGDLAFDLRYDSGTMHFQAAPDAALPGEAAPPGESSVAAAGSALRLNVQEVAQSFAWQVEEGQPPSASTGGVRLPAHILVTFDGEDPQEVLANNGRRLYIFPVQGYLDAAGEAAAFEIERLQTLLAEADGRVSSPENPMPLLPPSLGYMDRWVQFLDLNFVQGTGIRYISDSPNRQAIGPWTNETTAYYYQGLSLDGKFYVSLIWPLHTDSLPDTFEETTEAVKAQATNPTTYADYLGETRVSLNNLSPSDWEPDLTKLDVMIASLALK